MGSLSSSLKAVAELTVLTGQHLEQPLFQTLPVTQFGMTIWMPSISLIGIFSSNEYEASHK